MCRFATTAVRRCHTADIMMNNNSILRSGAWFLLASSSLILAGCDLFGTQPTQAAQKPPVRVVAARPVVRNITEWDAYTGRFTAVEDVQVRARVSGYLTKIHFTDGQLVQVGDLLFTIDRRPFELAVASAQADLKVAESTAVLARQDLARAEALRKTDAVSEQVLEQRTAAVRQDEARLAASQVALARANLDLEFTNIRSPVTGRIDAHTVSVGNLINGGDSNATLLTSIVSLDPIRVTFDVDQQAYLRYIRSAGEGTRPNLRDAPNAVRIALSDDEAFSHTGRLDFVSNQIDRDSATVRLRAIIDNKDLSLLPGLFAKVQLAERGARDAILIPDQAIAVDQAERIVFVVTNGKAELRTVTLGPTMDGLRVVRSGIGAEDLVVTSGLQGLRAGTEVTLLEAPQGAAERSAAAANGTVMQ